MQSYNQAIELAAILPGERINAATRSNLAMPLIALGAHDEALKHLYIALDIAKKQFNPYDSVNQTTRIHLRKKPARFHLA